MQGRIEFYKNPQEKTLSCTVDDTRLLSRYDNTIRVSAGGSGCVGCECHYLTMNNISRVFKAAQQVFHTSTDYYSTELSVVTLKDLLLNGRLRLCAATAVRVWMETALLTCCHCKHTHTRDAEGLLR